MDINGFFQKNEADMAALEEFFGLEDKSGVIPKLYGGTYSQLLNVVKSKIMKATGQMHKQKEEVEKKLQNSQDLLEGYKQEIKRLEQEIEKVRASFVDELKSGQRPTEMSQKLQPLKEQLKDAQFLAKSIVDEILPDLQSKLSSIDHSIISTATDILNEQTKTINRDLLEKAVELHVQRIAWEAVLGAISSENGCPRGSLKEAREPMRWEAGMHMTSYLLPSWAYNENEIERWIEG